MHAESAPVWLAPAGVGSGGHVQVDHTPDTAPAGFVPLSHPAAAASGHRLQAGEQQWEEDPDVKGKTVLLVLTGASGRKRVLRRILATGCHVICYNPECNWASQYLPSPEQWIFGPLDDAQAAVSCLDTWIQQQYNGKHPFQGVLCYDEYGVQLASILAQLLQLPFASPALVECMRNKFLFRKACRDGGIPVPRFARLHGPLQPADEVRIQQEGIRFPVVVKPSACAGSFAVLRVQSMQELKDAVQAFYDGLPAYLESVGLGPTSACAVGGMVVEEMLQGHEVDIDCVVVRGQLLFACVSDNHPPLPSSSDCCAFVERGGRCPSILPFQQQAELLHMASQVVGLWGDQLSGVFHLEAFSTHQGPRPIELNARIGGAETWTTVSHAWGVDLACQALRIALQLPPRFLKPLCASPAQTLNGNHSTSSTRNPFLHVMGASELGGELPAAAGPVGQIQEQQQTVQQAEEYPSSSMHNQLQSRTLVHGHHAPSCSMASSLSSCDHLDLMQQSSFSSSPGSSTYMCMARSMSGRSNMSSTTSLGALQGGQGGMCSSILAGTHHAPLQHRLSRQSNRDADLQHAPGSLHQHTEGVASCGQDDEGASLAPSMDAFEAVALQPVELHRPDDSAMTKDVGVSTCSFSASDLQHGAAAATLTVFSLEDSLTGCSSDGEQEQYSSENGVAAVPQYDVVGGGTPAMLQAISKQEASLHRRARCADHHFQVHSHSCDGASSGLAMQQACVQLAFPCKHVYSVNFVPEWEGEGVVEVMKVDAEVLASPAFVDVHNYVGPGAHVRLPPLGFSALGWMVASGQSPTQAEQSMTQLLQGVHIVLRKP